MGDVTMIAEKISFTRNRLHLGDRVIETKYSVADAILIDDRVVVLYDPDAYKDKMGQFPNLVAFDTKGEPLWTAQLPSNHSGERYHKIEYVDTLMAYTWGAYECEIDPQTGHILRKHHLQ